MKMKNIVMLFTGLVFISLVASACSQKSEEAVLPSEEALSTKAEKVTPSIEIAPSVEIVSPLDGEKVPAKFKVVFGAKGIDIVPAGTDQPNSGHHHLIINAELPDLSKPLGTNVIHFGNGQTETELELAPGVHTLQLVLGDKMHQPHNPPIFSKRISITVE
jgi:hypothetical protein